MYEFRKGDLVRLKSGGPKMTVAEIREDYKVVCDFFVGNERKSEVFDPKVLIKEGASTGGTSGGGTPEFLG